MREIIYKFINIEKNIAREKGDFWLFALFLREDAPNVWDLVVSAPWIKDDYDTLKYLSREINKVLTDSELLKLSHIAIISEDNPNLASLNKIKIEHGDVELKNCNFFGLEIKHAFIITSKTKEKLETVSAAQPA
ncbi:MAG: hypothetical protein HZA78_12080 [Candidatus Schekmanbacteria bacterium]|nr:hypothetical protein [Candidatus Schekmanbacteria bacterium]